MEEIKSQVQAHMIEFHCIGNNKGIHLCFNPNCVYSAIICGDPECKCTLERHDECEFIPFHRFVKRIVNKKQILSKELDQAFEAIDKIYVQMIEKISENREELALIKDNFGLSSDEASFLQLIKSRQSQAIKGSQINRLKLNINQQRDFTGINEANIKQSWELQKETFQTLINKLKRFYTDKQCFKDIQYHWSKEIEADSFKINQNKISKFGNISAYGFLQPSICFQKKNVFGIKFNKISGMVFHIGITNKQFIKYQTESNLGIRRVSHKNRLFCFYMVSTGFFYNEFNQKIPCFKFGVEDTIYIMYDPLTSEFKFWKNINQGFFKAKFQEKNKTKRAHFYVTNLQDGDQVELITQIPSINWSQQTKNQAKNINNRVSNPNNPLNRLFEQFLSKEI